MRSTERALDAVARACLCAPWAAAHRLIDVDRSWPSSPPGPVNLAPMLTDRAYLVLVARWRRARPRRDFGAWMEDEIAALVRERATLRCATCEAFTPHGHEADVRDELAGQVARLWRCSGCGSVRQCGAVELEAA